MTASYCFPKKSPNWSFWHFSLFFVQLIFELSGNTVWTQATDFQKKLAKLTILPFPMNFCTIKFLCLSVNGARFARNVVKCDFLSDFQTLCDQRWCARNHLTLAKKPFWVRLSQKMTSVTLELFLRGSKFSLSTFSKSALFSPNEV